MKSEDFNILEHVKMYAEESRDSVRTYLEQLSEKERLACLIAKDHLGSSFNILRSVGYIEWKTKVQSE
jgi:hypothetical protein